MSDLLAILAFLILLAIAASVLYEDRVGVRVGDKEYSLSFEARDLDTTKQEKSDAR